MPVVRAVYDPVVYNAANEVWSALGAVAIASASLYGLARIIREVRDTNWKKILVGCARRSLAVITP